MSPTQNSLKYLRETLSCYADVVEKWIPFAKIRKDLFGWIDIVAVRKDRGGVIMGIQTTSRSNVSARLLKAKGNQALACWLHCGGTLEIHGWSKVKNRWTIHRVPITLKDVE